MKKSVIFLVVLGNIAIAIAFVWFIVKVNVQENLMNRLYPHVEEYIDMDVESSKGRPYIRGKIFPINIDRKTVDVWLYSKLPSRIRAEDIDEVGTVIWVAWGWTRKSSFADLSKEENILSKATVTIIDASTKKLLGVKVFHGENPINSEERDAKFERAWPVEKVVDYVMSLPAK